jgi:hypothetical protein
MLNLFDGRLIEARAVTCRAFIALPGASFKNSGAARPKLLPAAQRRRRAPIGTVEPGFSWEVNVDHP